MLPKPKDRRLVLILMKLILSQLQCVYQYCMEGYPLQTYNPLWVLWPQPVVPGVDQLNTSNSMQSSLASCCMLSRWGMYANRIIWCTINCTNLACNNTIKIFFKDWSLNACPRKRNGFHFMFQHILKLSQCASCMLVVLQHQWMKQACIHTF